MTQSLGQSNHLNWMFLIFFCYFVVSNVGGVYANLNIQNDKEDDFVDEGAPTTLMKPATIEEDTSYYNISDIITTIKVSDLRSYIEQHQNGDTLQNQYKVCQ